MANTDTTKKEEPKKEPKSTGASFSLKKIKKDRDDLELLDGTKLYFKSITEFDDIDFLELQRKMSEAKKMGAKLTSFGDDFDEDADEESIKAQEKKSSAMLKRVRITLDGILKVILVQITAEQLREIGGFQEKMQIVTWWTDQNIAKKAPGQQD